MTRWHLGMIGAVPACRNGLCWKCYKQFESVKSCSFVWVCADWWVWVGLTEHPVIESSFITHTWFYPLHCNSAHSESFSQPLCLPLKYLKRHHAGLLSAYEWLMLADPVRYHFFCMCLPQMNLTLGSGDEFWWMSEGIADDSQSGPRVRDDSGNPPVSSQMMTFDFARCFSLSVWQVQRRQSIALSCSHFLPLSPSPCPCLPPSPCMCLRIFFSISPALLSSLFSFFCVSPSLSPALSISFLLAVPSLCHPWLSAAHIWG